MLTNSDGFNNIGLEKLIKSLAHNLTILHGIASKTQTPLCGFAVDLLYNKLHYPLFAVQ